MGMVLGSPFFVRSFADPMQRIALPFHLGYYPPDENDITYQMPAVTELRWSFDERADAGKLEFIAEPLKAGQVLQIGRIAIVRGCNFQRLRSQPMPVVLRAGDTLRVTYNLHVTNAHSLKPFLAKHPGDTVALAERLLDGAQE